MPAARSMGQELKRKNRNDIYQLLRRSHELSRQDIVRELQLSLPTVTQNINSLLADGLIAETGSVGNTGGRRAAVYSYVRSARLAIGLDITRHVVTAVAVDLDGQVVGKLQRRREFRLDRDYYASLGGVVREMAAKAGLTANRILGVGLAVPGLITADHQTVSYGKILDFTGATCATLAQDIPYPSALYNDADAAGYAEIWAAKDIQNAFYIMLSNNIGGAVLINNQVYAGENLRSGEIGHLTIQPDGLACYCGQKGCVEAYCNALVLASHTGDDLARFFRELRDGRSDLQTIWQKYLRHLAIAVNNLRILFDCAVILGGYVGEYMDDYLPDLRALVVERSTFDTNADYLQACRYKIEGSAAGAALPFISAFIDAV